MLAFLFIIFSLACAHGLQVDTTEGPVEGYSSADNRYVIFQGIPYAGPTSGQNRFKGPVPPPHRSGLFHANDSSVICAQPGSDGLIVGVEDCLTLSVMTTNVTTSKPVIVFLNSEDYTHTPIANYSVRSLVQNDIIFVNMNFRLSVFGFLCLGVQEAPGNAGLRDVIQGLKWIKANIANFGGNPNNITLMGHGSGAAMVDLLTLSPQKKNLVQRGIALSGSGLAPWAVAYDPIGYARLLAAKLGYSGDCLADLANHLANTDINILNLALIEFKFHNNTPLFAPCIENSKLNPSDTVIAEAPINILKSGNYSQIPFIYGYTTLEGTLRAEEAICGWLNYMQANFTDFLPVDLQFGHNKTAVSNQIRNFYFGNSSISYETVEDFLKFEGDTLILVSVIKTAIERAMTSKSEVRLIEFGFIGSSIKHGAFVDILIDQPPTVVFADEMTRGAIVPRFASFAHNWQPAPNLGALWAGGWAPITKNSTDYFYTGPDPDITSDDVISFTQEQRSDPHERLMNFWNNLYDKYYVAPSELKSSNETLHCPHKPNSAGVSLSFFFLVMLCQMLVQIG